MPLSRAQVETFCEDIAALFSIRPPRISYRPRIRCRWKRRTLHLGRTINRRELAHELAHYIQRELVWPYDPHPMATLRRGHLHGRVFRTWERLIGNYIAQEFGEGEGVIL